MVLLWMVLRMWFLPLGVEVVDEESEGVGV